MHKFILVAFACLTLVACGGTTEKKIVVVNPPPGSTTVIDSDGHTHVVKPNN